MPIKKYIPITYQQNNLNKFMKPVLKFKEYKIEQALKSMHIDDVTDDMVKEYLDMRGLDSEKPFTEEEVLEHLISHVNRIKKSKNPIKLYRIISADGIDDIDEDNLGTHFTTSKMYMDEHFMADIGIDDEQNLYIFEVLVDKKYIDVIKTLYTNIDWITENEVTLKPNSPIEIVDKYEY